MQEFKKKWFEPGIKPCPELNERDGNSRLQYKIYALPILQPYNISEEI